MQVCSKGFGIVIWLNDIFAKDQQTTKLLLATKVVKSDQKIIILPLLPRMSPNLRYTSLE